MTLWDIETSPLPPDQLAKVKPAFRAPGNYKDEAKIAAYVKEKEADWLERAALSSITGQVLAIGMSGPGYGPTIITGEGNQTSRPDEEWTIEHFWAGWRLGGTFVGFNIKGFDLPFLFQRSIILGIKPPTDLFEGRYWSSRFIDLQERWLCFNRSFEGHSMDMVCRALGMAPKGHSGAEFAKLWETDREEAKSYLRGDLERLAVLAEALGVR